MRLLRVVSESSPWGPERARLTGDIEYRDPARPAERIWFDVPLECADGLSESGDPWLACLLPLAVTLREPLELCRPVDPGLRDGAEAIMQVWQGWYPGVYEPIAIDADLLAPGIPDPQACTAAMFSAGLDSFHTLLRHEPGGDALHRVQIDDLLTIWGFDVPIAARDVFDRLRARVTRIADHFGKHVVTVATNLRESGWNVTNWGKLSQAPALAAVALSLERRYRRVLIPSSVTYRSRNPWGTHPLVDPLLSTTRTDIRNDGALASRFMKIGTVARSDLAMQHLRVCWIGRSDTNCGRCEKCLRTLTGFELLGLRDRCVTFPAEAWSTDALATLHLRQDLDRTRMERLRELAAAHSRADITRAIDRCIRRYDVRRAAGRVARALRLRAPEPT